MYDEPKTVMTLPSFPAVMLCLHLLLVPLLRATFFFFLPAFSRGVDCPWVWEAYTVKFLKKQSTRP